MSARAMDFIEKVYRRSGLECHVFEAVVLNKDLHPECVRHGKALVHHEYPYINGSREYKDDRLLFAVVYLCECSKSVVLLDKRVYNYHLNKSDVHDLSLQKIVGTPLSEYEIDYKNLDDYDLYGLFRSQQTERLLIADDMTDKVTPWHAFYTKNTEYIHPIREERKVSGNTAYNIILHDDDDKPLWAQSYQNF